MLPNLKNLTNLLGIILIITGILLIAYQGYTYTKHETVAQIGDLQVTADTKETVYISPVYGAIAFVAGVVLVVVSRRNSGQ